MERRQRWRAGKHAICITELRAVLGFDPAAAPNRLRGCPCPWQYCPVATWLMFLAGLADADLNPLIIPMKKFIKDLTKYFTIGYKGG
jgi:hypothetical protein